jgi:drug/metabolite transporter (DMT)-like permease
MLQTTTDRSKTRQAIAAGVLAAACWGLGTVFTKGLLAYIPPLPLLTAQLGASVIVLWAVIAIRQQLPPRQWQVWRLGFSGILEPGLSYILGVTGLSMTTASSATLIGIIEPCLIVVLAAWWLGERVSRPMIGAIGLALIGSILMIGLDASSNGSLTGNLLIGLGTFCAASYVILTRQFVFALQPLPLTALQQTFGLVVILLFWLLIDSSSHFVTSLQPFIWLEVILSGIVKYTLPFWLYLTALQYIQASTTSLLLTLIPLFGVSGGYLFLQEQLTLTQWIGAAITLIGVCWLPRLQSQPRSETLLH